jgi:hypothetical protein
MGGHKAARAQRSERIFPEPENRVPDSAQQASLQILPSSMGIQEIGLGIGPGHGIDREVTARQVRQESLRTPARNRRHFYAADRGQNLNGSMLQADGSHSRKERCNTFGRRIGRQIPVLGLMSEQMISERSPDDPYGMPGFSDALHGLEDVFGDMVG